MNWRWLGLATVAFTTLASCGASAPSNSSTIARAAASTSAAPSSSVPETSTTSTSSPPRAPVTLTSTSVTTTSSSTSTTALPVQTMTTAAPPQLEGAVGEVLTIDAVLVDPANMATIPREPVQLEVWLVQRGTDDSSRQTSVRLGAALLGLDGRVQLRATVSSMIATRYSRFGLAVPGPMRAGDYVIRGIANLAIPVRVTNDAPVPPVPKRPPAPIDATRRILGERDLAGVAFGTRDDDAEAALTSQLGAPTARTDWQGACIGQARRVAWGSLTVTFRRDDANADGALASYEYGSIVPGRAEGAAGFGTVHDITIGTTIEELRAVDDTAEIHTGYDGFDATNWTVRGSELVARLDRDFLDPDAKVVRIAAPRTATLQVC